MAEVNLQFLFNSKEKQTAIKKLMEQFPRITYADIVNESNFIIHYYGVDNIELWVNDYSNLETLLKQSFSKYHSDKNYYIKPLF